MFGKSEKYGPASVMKQALGWVINMIKRLRSHTSIFSRRTAPMINKNGSPKAPEVDCYSNPFFFISFFSSLSVMLA